MRGSSLELDDWYDQSVVLALPDVLLPVAKHERTIGCGEHTSEEAVSFSARSYVWMSRHHWLGGSLVYSRFLPPLSPGYYPGVELPWLVVKFFLLD